MLLAHQKTAVFRVKLYTRPETNLKGIVDRSKARTDLFGIREYTRDLNVTETVLLNGLHSISQTLKLKD